MTKYYIRRVVIPSIKLDFDIFSSYKDKEQFDLFWNLIFSAWVQNAPKGTELRVYDYLGSLQGQNKNNLE
jgi:hypothetical protein